MKKKFKFIELPKGEVQLSDIEQSFLMGRSNCGVLRACDSKYADSLCEPYDENPCSKTGSCGGGLYCLSFSCGDKKF